jgi:BirA family biotin operon repressor/biotin-[acetyl-CoA-carboxylase] ligase
LQNNAFSGLFVGQNIITLKRVDSTNNYLKNEVSKSAPLPEGTVILAEEQFAGRGQQSNRWISEPGRNLTFSLLLNPFFLHPSRQFMLNKTISVAVNEALSSVTGEPFAIKWPNDIYFGPAKAGGMLIENILSGASWKHAIIGIGINVNQRHFPEQLANATSLSKILQRDYSLDMLLSQLCSYIESWYLRLRAGDEKEIESSYLSRLFRYGKTGRYGLPGGDVIEGIITGVSSQGKLELLTRSGACLFDLKEIAFLAD